MPLRCEIITQERRLFDQDVDLIIAPGAAGEMTILPNHAPLVSTLDFGEQAFAIGGGVLEIAANHVIVLADSAEQATEIDAARAESARQRAQKIMAEGPPEDPSAYAALETAIRRANLRMKVARRHERSGAGRSDR